MIDKIISLLGGQTNTIAFAILAAVIGFLAKGTYDLWIARRKGKLERINSQLKLLYGPLFALVNVSTITWKAFIINYCQRDDFQVKGGISPQTPEAKTIWRHWISNVFMPLNIQMAKIITDNADLLEDEVMPECLLLLSAHVHGYKGIIAAWEKGDYSEHMSLTSFPQHQLSPYVQETYQKLKTRQANLIGRH